MVAKDQKAAKRALAVGGEYAADLRQAKWPEDPVKAERLKWVAHYSRLGYSMQAVARALKHHLPIEEHGKLTTWHISRDLRQLQQIWRHEALKDADLIFGEIDASLQQLAEMGFRTFYERQYPRLEPHNPQTKKTDDGREPSLMPAATPGEAAGVIQTIQRVLTARAMLHFGPKGAQNIVINNVQQNNVSLGSKNGANFSLREQAELVRQALFPRNPEEEAIIDVQEQKILESPHTQEQEIMEAAVKHLGSSGNTDSEDFTHDADG